MSHAHSQSELPSLRDRLRLSQMLAEGIESRSNSPWIGWTPLASLPLLVVGVRSILPPWGVMWAMLAAVFAAFKWLTWWQARDVRRGAPRWRSLAYLVAWPGMDATAFLRSNRLVPRPSWSTWALAVLKTTFGVAVLWGFARSIPAEHMYAAGWVAMIGLAFFLHFGLFHLLALGWQSCGINARPIFRSPALARSVGDFWGSRWNLAFRDLSYSLVFRPLVGRLGVTGATLAAFAVSGLIHELVISVPAAAGYGLPTAYFLMQCLGVLAERSGFGAGRGLRGGLTGWLFTLLFTAGPACLLFHPPFVDRVVVPFLRSIGAM